jgi:hypothetical protein
MRIGCALAGVAVLGIAGCGDDEHANHERPAATINVTAAIAGGRIHVSPRTFGAGPIRLIISNQMPAEQELTFETADGDTGVTQTTAPIPPAGTATLEVVPAEGAYEVSTGDGETEPVAVKVGAPRPSAQNELLQP